MSIENQGEAIPYRTITWVLMGFALVFILSKHLLIALFAGLLVHEVVFLLEPKLLHIIKLERDVAKASLVALVATIVIAVFILFAIGVYKYFQVGSENLPALLNKMAEVLESSKNALPQAIHEYLPSNVDELHKELTTWLRDNAGAIRGFSKEAGRALALVIIGMIIGAMIALRKTQHLEMLMPFQLALAARVSKLALAFRQVVFAQVRIAAINAVSTGIYLKVILPLLGVELPFAKTMIALTFIFGLLPVVGNLASNTIIVIVSLSYSPTIAMGSLAFLIVIHKAEYFLNAQIIGTRIQAKAWEILIVMLTLESLFGLKGVVAAPIYYAYLKAEMCEAGLIAKGLKFRGK